MTVPAAPAMVDVIDTYYVYITTQWATLGVASNPATSFQGMVNAQDWPQVEIVDGGLYLLYLNSAKVDEDSTRAQEYWEHYLQWAWVFIGNDLQPNQIGFNRASRYRADMAVVEGLRQAHFPGFCPKQFSANDGADATVTLTNYSPVEMIHWSAPRLGTKMANAQSGVLYGAAPVEVYAWSTVSPLVNV